MKSLENIIDESFDCVSKLSDFPIRRELLSYPINLSGHYCELDCSFQERRLAVEAAARTKPAPVRQYIEKLEHSMDQVLEESLQKVSVSYRQADISKYLIEAESLHGDTSRVEEGISYIKTALRSDPAILSMEAGLTAAEYMTGLKKDPAQIPKKILDICEKELKCPFDWEAYRLGRTETPNLTKLEIHMEDTSWYSRFMELSDLSLYAPETHPESRLPTAEDYEDFLEHFSENTYRRELVIYESLEKQEIRPVIDGKQETSPVTREDLIFIDGISLKDWTNYSMNMHSITTSREAVSSALLSQALTNSDHYVECYLPDEANRTIRTEPVRLTQEGIEPAQMDKPSMNAWQRFWSKHGHYQELAAKMKRYETVSDMRKQAAESVKTLAAGVSSSWQEKELSQTREVCREGAAKAASCKKALGAHLFGPAYAIDHSGVTDSNYYKLDRSGINLGICLLLHDGLTLDEIMDPEKELDRKQAAGERLKAMALRDDPKEFLSFVIPAMEQIMALPNIQMDYMDLKEAAPHATEIAPRAIMSDMFQEASRPRAAIREVMGPEESREFLDRAERYGAFYYRLSQCMELSTMPPEANKSNLAAGISFLGQYHAMVRDFGAQMNGGASPDRLPNLHLETQRDILDATSPMVLDDTPITPQKNLYQLLQHGLSGRPVAEITAPTPHNPAPTARLALFDDAPQKTAPAPSLQARPR